MMTTSGMMTTKRYIRLPHRQGGVGLIEVLITLAVVAFGLLALARFQVDLIRDGSDSKRRTAAVNLAMQKTDDLRRYTTLTGATESYTIIANNAGGLVDPATGGLKIPAGVQTISGTAYTLAWTVTNYYYSGLNTAPTTTVPTPAPTYVEFKKVRVSVTWSDEQGTAENVALETVIAPLSPLDSGLVASGTGPLYAAP